MILRAQKPVLPDNDYPTSDGKPMAETDLHRKLMAALIETLEDWFASDPNVYVSGNLLVFYREGDKRVHVAPDVFVVRGVQKALRPNYLLWKESPLDLVIELTSKTTMMEDIEEKYNLYVGELGVKEYFLFDPEEEYLHPSFQGYRRGKKGFVPIKPVAGRMMSKVLGLHLERVGDQLRLWDPSTGAHLPTRGERAAAEAERAATEAERAAAEAERANQAELENRRLREELARVRGKRNGK
jgi:Uma2 family endonuclease